MKKISSTNAQNRFGSVLDDSKTEPVLITSYREPVAVLISWKEYRRLRSLDDDYWVGLAMKASGESYVDEDELEEWLMETLEVGETDVSKIEIDLSREAQKFLETISKKQLLKVLSAVFNSPPMDTKIENHPFHKVDIGRLRIIYEYVGKAPSIAYAGRR